MAEFSKVAQYQGWRYLPPLVERAVQLSIEMNFDHSCTPHQGELLSVLARGRDGGTIGETGTGCGAGLAWMTEAVSPSTRLISVERDADRAAACQHLFAGYGNVTVLHGDWTLIESHAPFDLLVLDGGGGGKRAGTAKADPARLLVPGGTVVLDDFHPPMTVWPEDADQPPDEFGRSVAQARAHWLQHPDLFASEVRVHPQLSSIVGTLKAPG